MPIPRKESELVTYTENFSTKISATPATYGLTAAQASAFATLNTAWVSAYTTANEPSTRTVVTVEAKNQAKVNMLANLRSLIGIVQSTPTVTGAAKLELGITPRDVEPTPIPPPGFAPGLSIVSVTGRNVRVRLFDPANPTRRGKPPFIEGCSVFSFVGDEAPSDPALYKFEGSSTRTLFDVGFPESVPVGAKVWLTAFWTNPRLMSGPACVPVSTNLNFGGPALPAAA
jgi:hypothetical protein